MITLTFTEKIRAALAFAAALLLFLFVTYLGILLTKEKEVKSIVTYTVKHYTDNGEVLFQCDNATKVKIGDSWVSFTVNGKSRVFLGSISVEKN